MNRVIHIWNQLPGVIIIGESRRPGTTGELWLCIFIQEWDSPLMNRMRSWPKLICPNRVEKRPVGVEENGVRRPSGFVLGKFLWPPPLSRFPSLLFLTRPEPLSYGKEAPAKMRLSRGTGARQRLASRKVRCCRLGGHNSSLPEKELGMVLTWDPKAGHWSWWGSWSPS